MDNMKISFTREFLEELKDKYTYQKGDYTLTFFNKVDQGNKIEIFIEKDKRLVELNPNQLLFCSRMDFGFSKNPVRRGLFMETDFSFRYFGREKLLNSML